MNIKYCVFSAAEWERSLLKTLAIKGIVACVKDSINVVVARYGTNKRTLKKTLKAL